MKSIKMKTQKTLSAILGLALAAATLLQAGNIESKESASNFVSIEEAEILADIEEMLMEDEELMIDEIIEEITSEELQTEVKVFNSNNELVAQGQTEGNEELRLLVNKAELLSVNGDTQYFRISQ